MRIRNVPLRAFGPYAGARRGLSGFGAFGTWSQWQVNRDCPVGGDWTTWCNCVFAAGSDLHTKCVAQPLGPFSFAPWTDGGAIVRGLPKPGLLASITGTATQIITGTLPTTQTPVQSPATMPPVGILPGEEAESSIFGIPKTIAYVGGGVLALGVAALAFSGGGKRR